MFSSTNGNSKQIITAGNTWTCLAPATNSPFTVNTNEVLFNGCSRGDNNTAPPAQNALVTYDGTVGTKYLVQSVINGYDVFCVLVVNGTTVTSKNIQTLSAASNDNVYVYTTGYAYYKSSTVSPAGDYYYTVGVLAIQCINSKNTKNNYTWTLPIGILDNPGDNLDKKNNKHKNQEQVFYVNYNCAPNIDFSNYVWKNNSWSRYFSGSSAENNSTTC